MTAEKDPSRAIGDSLFVDINQLLPHLNTTSWLPIELSGEEWARLEQELEKPLSADLRQSTCDVITYFIHSLRLKEKIPTARNYGEKLQSRIGEIIDTADNLLSQITAQSPPPPGNNAISPKAAKRLLGGRPATWNDAAKAAQTTQEEDEVWAAADHVRLLLTANFPDVLAGAQSSLLELLRRLHGLKGAIAEVPHNKAGADGDYELNLLLTDLLRVARAAGDECLKLASHDIRDKVMRDTVKPNPAYRFAEGVVHLILGSADSLASGLDLDDADRLALVQKIRANLDRRPGTLIDRLDKARALILSAPQAN